MKTKFITKSEEINVREAEKLVVFDILVGDTDETHDVTINLLKEGAEVELYGLFFGDKTQNFTVSHVVKHCASNTISKLVTKGVLDDSAKTNYASNIIIEKDKSGCFGDQKEDTLLLSRDSHIDAVPALEIANDDVQASHSVSTTYVDEVKKFYLESRGMEEKEAVETIVKGHLSEILDRIKDSELKNNLIKKISMKLK